MPPSQSASQSEAITEIRRLLEGALLGHRLDQPFTFSRGESTDIERALEVARGISPHELDSPDVRELAEALTGEPLVPFERPPVTVDPLIYRLMAEVKRQDGKHGPFEGTTLGRSRLALACLDDEVKEAHEAWREERKALSWDATRTEVLQVAAVAIRALRDAL